MVAEKFDLSAVPCPNDEDFRVALSEIIDKELVYNVICDKRVHQ